MQGIISSPHLTPKLLFNVSQQWSLYPNRYVAALASDSMDVLVPHVHLSLNPILAKLEGGRYVGPIIPKSLEYLVHETGSRGGSGGSIGGSSDSGGATSKKRKASPTGGREDVGALRCAPALPVPLGQGELVLYPGGDGPPDPAW